MGLIIKQKLREFDLTNKWLLKQLNLAGYDVCRESLSRYINGKQKTDDGDRILEAALEILKDYEETERLKACY